MTDPSAQAKPAQIRLTRRSAAYWRVTIGNPPINGMGPEMVREFQEVIGALEADETVLDLFPWRTPLRQFLPGRHRWRFPLRWSWPV